MKKKIILYVNIKKIIYFDNNKKTESSVASVCIGMGQLSAACLPKLSVYQCKFK
jgi:hypothetical protein